MYCQNCGTKNRDEAIFCESCGVQLEREEMETCILQEYIPEQNNMVGYGLPQQPSAQVPPPQVPPPNRNVPKIRKPAPVGLLIVLAEVFALCVVIYIAFGIGKKGFSAEQTGTDFFVMMANGDLKNAYSRLDIDETEFLNKKMFLSAKYNLNIGAINDYAIEKSEKGYEDFMKPESKLGTDIYIRYRSKGSTSDSIYPLTLNKQSEKKWFFFDDWKVGTETLICNEYFIYAPVGATVTVDGVELTEKYVDQGSTDQEEIGLVYYKIPQIFYGTHKISITMEDYQEVIKTVTITGGSTGYGIDEMQLSEETTKTLIQLAGKAMQEIYTAAMEGKSFQTIQDLFVVKERSEVEKSYNYLVENLVDSYSGIPFKLDFKNIKGSMSTDEPTVSLEFEYTLHYSYQYRDDEPPQNDFYADESTTEFEFTKEDGNWVLMNQGARQLSY